MQIFRRTLSGQARLWAEGKEFATLQALKDSFIARFSPGQTPFALAKEFTSLTFNPGDSAEQHLSKIRQLANQIGYGEVQIRDKFLTSLPIKCQAAVVMAAPENATAQELAARAQRYIELDVEKDLPKEVTFVTQDDEIRSELGALRKQIESLNFSRPSSGDRRAKSPAPRSRPNSNSRSREHSRDRGRDRSDRTIFCDYCLYPGHVWRHYRKRQGELDRRGPYSYSRSPGRRRDSHRSPGPRDDRDNRSYRDDRDNRSYMYNGPRDDRDDDHHNGAERDNRRDFP